VLGLAELSLGDTAAALQTLRKNLALAQRLEEPFNVSMAEFYLAQALSQTPDGLPEGVGITEKMLRTEQNARSVYIGGAHCVRAQFLIVRGELGEAESAAREAIAVLTPLPIQRVAAMIVLARILLLQQRSQDACHITEEALQVIESCGGIGPGEIAALVTAAEARHAAGEGAGAHTALREAVQRLAFILQRIPDPAMRQCFVSLPENHRALELEQAWNLQPSSIEGSEHEQDRASSVQESGQPAP
jgi:tetratricopeptide (TPR) repeat protein